MASPKDQLELMEFDIDEDGLVSDPYQGIETRYCRVEVIAFSCGDRGEYIQIVGDDGGTNVEVRIPYDRFMEFARFAKRKHQQHAASKEPKAGTP